ncbi:hypothetical protein GW17_00009204 [Ensete ventricosum]|nr:hypothetical protein GW17_00009204 [Ensete ventricosum]
MTSGATAGHDLRRPAIVPRGPVRDARTWRVPPGRDSSSDTRAGRACCDRRDGLSFLYGDSVDTGEPRPTNLLAEVCVRETAIAVATATATATVTSLEAKPAKLLRRSQNETRPAFHSQRKRGARLSQNPSERGVRRMRMKR